MMPEKAHRHMICMRSLLVGENIDVRGYGMSYFGQRQRVDATAVCLCVGFIGAVFYYASCGFFGVDRCPGALCSPQRGLFDSEW